MVRSIQDSLRGHLVVVHPVSKKLACGDIGVGGLASIDSIVSTVEDIIAKYTQNKSIADN